MRIVHNPHGDDLDIAISASDEVSDGGGPIQYRVAIPTGELAPLHFMHGALNSEPNGLTNEVLLAIVKDRLECFQAGAYPCKENDVALVGVTGAMIALGARASRIRNLDANEKDKSSTVAP